MSMNKSILGLAASMLVILGGCSSASNMKTIKVENSYTGAPMIAQPVEPTLIGSHSVGMVLKASVFRMNGDYANNVAVTLGPNGELTYFPAPTDIRKSSAPVALGEGWWLNRQGLSAGSVFTRWTFEEYARLKTCPSIEEIKSAIIPGAMVTEFQQLPIPASEANAMKPAELLKLIK